MTLLSSMTMPSFEEDELVVLRQVEALLQRHPYMRADLGGSGPVARKLEGVLSMRLALLHTKSTRVLERESDALLEKLRAWEEQLANAVIDEEGSKQALLRRTTILLLHPEPRIQDDPATIGAQVAHVTSAWEQVRQSRRIMSVLTEKLRQNRDFFRHGAMLPFYWRRRRRIRRLLPNVVLEDSALRETWFAIEQIGPLVDNFAFGGAAGVPRSTSVAVADLAFFYMQLADEFLDELAAAAGGHDAAGELVRSIYRNDQSERPLCDLSLDHIRRLGVEPDAHATKFGITLSALFDALAQLAAAIDGLLRAADHAVVRSTHIFLHHCFQTYLDEAELCASSPGRRADQMRLQDTAWHFYRKNNLVMMLWLDLRARALGLEPQEHADAIRRWGYLLAAFQIFDDLKDIALDLAKQPSYPLQIAANDFPSEFKWLEQRFGQRRLPVTRDEVPEVNLRASGTVRQCMRWSRLIALAHFDNALLYAWDQRWRKSWTRRRRSFNPRGSAGRTARAHAVDRLIFSLLAIRGTDATSPVDDDQLAFALDATAYDGARHIYLALFPNIRAIYRFATLRMWMTASEKSLAARKLLRRYPRARANALVGLADADVDHQVAGDRFEAFSKLIEI
jgi:GNAT superfamily N-acetyltransferase